MSRPHVMSTLIPHIYVERRLSGRPNAASVAVVPGCPIPVSLVRFSVSALSATTSVQPDIDSAAISGLSTNGWKTPAASGNASVL